MFREDMAHFDCLDVSDANRCQNYLDTRVRRRLELKRQDRNRTQIHLAMGGRGGRSLALTHQAVQPKESARAPGNMPRSLKEGQKENNGRGKGGKDAFVPHPLSPGGVRIYL